MPEGAEMAADQSFPKVREDDARGCPAGGGVVEGKPLHPGSNPGRIGNPPFVPTDEQRRDVEAWVRGGLQADDIAILLDKSRSTIDRHFKRELKVGRIKVKLAIGTNLTQKALRGNLTAQIFWLRTQAKWNVRVEHTGPDGGAIKTFDLSALGSDEKRVLLAVIDQLLAQQEEEKPNGDDAADGDQPSVN
jgi:hypothetical protein